MANLLLPLGLVRVLKSVFGSQLAQPRCHLGFAHAIVYGQATTGRKELNVFMRSLRVPYIRCGNNSCLVLYFMSCAHYRSHTCIISVTSCDCKTSAMQIASFVYSMNMQFYVN